MFMSNAKNLVNTESCLIFTKNNFALFSNCYVAQLGLFKLIFTVGLFCTKHCARCRQDRGEKNRHTLCAYYVMRDIVIKTISNE